VENNYSKCNSFYSNISTLKVVIVNAVLDVAPKRAARRTSFKSKLSAEFHSQRLYSSTMAATAFERFEKGGKKIRRLLELNQRPVAIETTLPFGRKQANMIGRCSTCHTLSFHTELAYL